MAKIKFPNKDRKWNVSYVGEYFGDIKDNYNVDFDNIFGTISLNNFVLPYTVTQDIAGMIGATDYVYSNFSGTQSYWAACEKLYKISTTDFGTGNNFAADTLTNSPTSLTDSDIIICGVNTSSKDIAVVSTNTDLAHFDTTISATDWDKNWWTVTLAQGVLLTGKPHPMITYGTAPVLFIGDGNKLHSIGKPTGVTTADVNNSRLVFDKTKYINWIQKTNDKIYIGLKDNNGDGYASQFVEYDPYNETVRVVDVKEGATIGFVDNNIVYILDQTGQFRQWDGSSLRPISYFPGVFNGIGVTLPHRNGIDRQGREILFAISSTSAINHGGIYSYSYDNGFIYHKNSLTNKKSIQSGFGITYVTMSSLFVINSSSFLCGAETQLTSGGTAVNGIFSLGTKQTSVAFSNTNCGYVITAKIPSEEIDSIWRNILIKYNPNNVPHGVQSSESKVLVKYKTTDQLNSSSALPTGTWVTATTFTVTTSTVPNIAVGNEIFVLNGDNNGLLAHITKITGTTTLTITIDTGFLTSPAGDFIFSYSNWKLIPQSITSLTQQNLLLDIPDVTNSEWIQFKIVSSSPSNHGLVLEEVQVGYQPNNKVEI